MMEMMERYRHEYGCGCGIPATYEVRYRQGKKIVAVPMVRWEWWLRRFV